MGMAGDSDQGSKSYLVNTFTKWDWGIILVLAAMFVTAAWFAVKLTIAAETAEIRASITILEDEVEDMQTALMTRIDTLDADLTTAFEAYAATIDEAVDRGMKERTVTRFRAPCSRSSSGIASSAYVSPTFPGTIQKR